MATEVRHGPNPTFDHQTSGGEYGLTLVSHYTTTIGVAAGGVTAYKYASDQESKRRAELLNMRTIFLEWWIDQWVACGGSMQDGIEALSYRFTR